MNLPCLRQALDTHKIGAAELASEYIKRIKEHNSKLNCYISVCEDTAGEQAKQAQTVIDSGKADFLTGIPFAIKDNICTENLRTTCASRMLESFTPTYDATAVKKLKAVNAVILGKTNMDEFAIGSSSATSYFGRTNNPYNTDCSPGGSSGGSAAAVAADLCAASLSSDTGGSTTQPAALCGITGLKPTYGAISRYGLIPYASSLDCIGIMVNSAIDTGYVLNAVHGYDINDSTSSHKSAGDYTAVTDTDVSKLKLGIPREFFESTDECVYKAVLSAVDFYKSAGCEIVECSLPSLKYAVQAYYIISSAEVSSNLAKFDGIRYGYCSKEHTSYSELVKSSRTEAFGASVKHRIILGNYLLSPGLYDDYYKKACAIREKIKLEYADIFRTCDAVITPTTPKSSYKHGIVTTPSDALCEDICTVPPNLAGLPVISTTCGYSDEGMPVGMSITGKAFDERTIIALCDRFEQSFGRKRCVL